MKRISIIGGTFDDASGKPSGIIGKYFNHNAFLGFDVQVDMINGGHFDDLEGIVRGLEKSDIILWFPNVSNEKPKVRNIKGIYPNKIVVTSKRNADQRYGFASLINRILMLKSNLLLEFTESNGVYQGRVFDPLGTVWCDYCSDFKVVAGRLVSRAIQLSDFSRCPTHQVGPKIEAPNMEEFFSIVKGYAETFHRLIHPEEGVTRFLGNASFRCERGFPSFRDGDLIFVSRRNVDKRYIGRESFVAARLNGDRVEYYGDDKPSVDTPVQLNLYDYYRNVNFMVHSHTYIEGAPFTEHPIPCGALEEIDEIVEAVRQGSRFNFSVNLIGHGSLALSRDVDYLAKIKYIARNVPERLRTLSKLPSTALTWPRSSCSNCICPACPPGYHRPRGEDWDPHPWNFCCYGWKGSLGCRIKCCFTCAHDKNCVVYPCHADSGLCQTWEKKRPVTEAVKAGS